MTLLLSSTPDAIQQPFAFNAVGVGFFAALGFFSALLAVLLAWLTPPGSWLRKLVLGNPKTEGLKWRIAVYLAAGSLAAGLLFVVNPALQPTHGMATGFAPVMILGYFYPPGRSGKDP